jgi:hypothetical protein
LARERKRDLGKIPEPKNYDLRLKCKDDLLLFFQSYMKDSFPIPFSADHLADIKTIQDCIIHKMLFALSAPRGNGKTTIVKAATIWAMLYGHCRYIVPIAAD